MDSTEPCMAAWLLPWWMSPWVLICSWMTSFTNKRKPTAFCHQLLKASKMSGLSPLGWIRDWLKPIYTPQIVVVMSHLAEVNGRKVRFRVVVKGDKGQEYATCDGTWISFPRGKLWGVLIFKPGRRHARGSMAKALKIGCEVTVEMEYSLPVGLISRVTYSTSSAEACVSVYNNRA